MQALTAARSAERVRELCDGFATYLDAFTSAQLFSGPSTYFHHKTLAIRAGHEGNVRACLRDQAFVESLYATLAAWGMHRMGPGSAKLAEFGDFAGRLRSHADQLAKLERRRISELSTRDTPGVTNDLWSIIAGVGVATGNTVLVAGTKALHHLLPDLLPPMDREYTVRFFFGNRNAIQGEHKKQHAAFAHMYAQCVTIGRTASGTGAKSYLGHGMHTSVTKLIDNAIIGYGRSVLRIQSEISSGGEVQSRD